MGLVTTDTVIDYLDLGSLSVDDTVALSDLIDRVSDGVERELDWYFGPARPASEVLDGTRTSQLFVRQTPINATDMTVYRRSGVGGTWEVVDEDEYEVDGRAIHAAGRWAGGKRNFRVDYAEGFAKVPGEIRQIVLEVVGNAWGSRDVSAVGIVSESIGDYSYSKGAITISNADSYSRVRSSWRRLRL